MRRTLLIAAAAVLAAAAARRAEAQDLAELQARLARLRATEVFQDPAMILRAKRQAELNRPGAKPSAPGSVDSRPVAAIGWGRSGPVLVGLERREDAAVVAVAVDSALRALGMDSARTARLAVVEADRVTGRRLTDTDRAAVEGRELLRIGVPGGRANVAVSDREWRSWAAEVVLSRIGDELTPDALRVWTGPLSLSWTPVVSNRGLLVELAESEATPAARCLGGDGEACAAYLGIDTGADPLRHRFPPEDARRIGPAYAGGRDPLRARQCEAGVLVECYRALERYGPPSASTPRARESLLMYVAARYGAEAFQRILADTAAQIDVRVTRATGASPADLGAGWRAWILETARVTPVRAGVREIFSAAIALAMLVGLATRSGRWFA